MLCATVKRFELLDWLRGLLACSIMVYHLGSWEGFEVGGFTILGRLGIYGVSTFFVISGLSMAMMYHGRLKRFEDIKDFTVRRFFRIWPLLLFAISLVTAMKLSLGEDPQWWRVAINVTAIFAFVSPGNYINVGAWSLGNEIVYYSLTPILIFLLGSQPWMKWAIGVSALIWGTGYTWLYFDSRYTFESQWIIYVNPLCNFHFYILGMVIFYVFDKVHLNFGWCIGALTLGIALLAWLPGESLSDVVIGLPRLFFTIACCLIVLGTFKLSWDPPKMLNRPLVALGLISYGVYLLHPILYQVFKMDPSQGRWAVIVFVIAATPLFAAASFRFVEQPMVLLSKWMTSRRRDAPKVPAS